MGIWSKLAKKMYGECSRRLQQRMFIAWRRKRAGCIRERVLSSLHAEGVLTCSNSVTLSTDISNSQHLMDSHTAVDFENHSETFASNGYCVTDIENEIQSPEHNVCAETVNDTPVYTNDDHVNNADIERNHDRLVVSRLRHIHIRHKLAVSSDSLRGRYNCFCAVL